MFHIPNISSSCSSLSFICSWMSFQNHCSIVYVIQETNLLYKSTIYGHHPHCYHISDSHTYENTDNNIFNFFVITYVPSHMLTNVPNLTIMYQHKMVQIGNMPNHTKRFLTCIYLSFLLSIINIS